MLLHVPTETSLCLFFNLQMIDTHIALILMRSEIMNFEY